MNTGEMLLLMLPRNIPGCAPFVACIMENLGQSGPWLVYADWLEEHGETKTAESIRKAYMK